MKRIIRCLLLLLLAAPALAQTTTTTLPQGACVQVPASELAALLGRNPNWQYLLDYAARHHFETATYRGVLRCSPPGFPDSYVAFLQNLRTGRPDAKLFYLPGAPASSEMTFFYQKSVHTWIELGPTGGARLAVDSDEVGRNLRLYDAAGRKLHLNVPPAPAARRRHL